MTRLHVVAAALFADKRVLAARRGEQMREPLKWEFPGGKVESGETSTAALSREIAEELGIVVSVGRQLGVSKVAGLELELFVCQLVSGVPVAREHAELVWVAHHELSSLDWAPADVPLLDSVARALRDLD